MPNHLKDETSPYLLQHANNPVDWYPWCEESLRVARERNVPIFLSVGYSACHWCHVMAHESFEDPDTAAIMNLHFVNIKVDREERPDLDKIYMDAVVAMTGRGGWPMSVFLTPDGVPFYGGTYFPAGEHFGLPSFKRVLLSVARSYRERPAEIAESKERLSEYLQQSVPGSQVSIEPGLATLDGAFQNLLPGFDRLNGGLGNAPKFPQPMILEFLLRYFHLTGKQDALDVVDLTLTRMAAGGVYDHLGGGFHRYATDERWLVPHFEKMLYDNALLAWTYLHAWQVTRRPMYRRVVEETLDYVLREMRHPNGGFYTAQDADSQGVEGKFYVWSREEMESLLGSRIGPLVCDYFGVTVKGNFEGQNVLSLSQDDDAAAAAAGIEPAEFREVIDGARRVLFEAREDREKPGRDDKILTSWNGLMMAAFAEAGRVLNRPDFLQTAEQNATFVLKELRQNERLQRSWKASGDTSAGQARFNAYLEDYAFYAHALLTLYQATFDVQWFIEAQSLVDVFVATFEDDDWGFFDTSDDHESLFVRPKQLQDNAIPSGNAMAVDVLLRLSALTGSHLYVDLAERMLEAMAPVAQQHPAGFGHWLSALAFRVAPPHQVAVVGDPDSADTIALLEVLSDGYRPHQVVALGLPGDNVFAQIPLLAGRETQEHRATAYVCRDFVCYLPVIDPEMLAAELR